MLCIRFCVIEFGHLLYVLFPVNRPCISMPTWQFDPATGDAYQVSNGGQPLEDPSAPTQAEVEEFHIQQSAQDYARRKSIEATPQINTDNPNAELKLAEVQQRLFSEDLNPLQRLQLEALSEKLAASLVKLLPFRSKRPRKKTPFSPLMNTRLSSQKILQSNPFWLALPKPSPLRLLRRSIA